MCISSGCEYRRYVSGMCMCSGCEYEKVYLDRCVSGSSQHGVCEVQVSTVCVRFKSAPFCVEHKGVSTRGCQYEKAYLNQRYWFHSMPLVLIGCR